MGKKVYFFCAFILASFSASICCGSPMDWQWIEVQRRNFSLTAIKVSSSSFKPIWKITYENAVPSLDGRAESNKINKFLSLLSALRPMKIAPPANPGPAIFVVRSDQGSIDFFEIKGDPFARFRPTRGQPIWTRVYPSSFKLLSSTNLEEWRRSDVLNFHPDEALGIDLEGSDCQKNSYALENDRWSSEKATTLLHWLATEKVSARRPASRTTKPVNCTVTFHLIGTREKLRFWIDGDKVKVTNSRLKAVEFELASSASKLLKTF